MRASVASAASAARAALRRHGRPAWREAATMENPCVNPCKSVWIRVDGARRRWLAFGGGAVTRQSRANGRSMSAAGPCIDPGPGRGCQWIDVIATKRFAPAATVAAAAVTSTGQQQPTAAQQPPASRQSASSQPASQQPAQQPAQQTTCQSTVCKSAVSQLAVRRGAGNRFAGSPPRPRSTTTTASRHSSQQRARQHTKAQQRAAPHAPMLSGGRDRQCSPNDNARREPRQTQETGGARTRKPDAAGGTRLTSSIDGSLDGSLGRHPSPCPNPKLLLLARACP